MTLLLALLISHLLVCFAKALKLIAIRISRASTYVNPELL